MANETDVMEDRRLTALAQHDILDTPSEEAFDRITRLTTHVFNVSMSTVTFLDGHRQWFKSRQGVVDCETAKGPAFCNVAIQQNEPLIVPDTHADDRFRQNPFVVGRPFIRFYAGAQLRAADGTAIGILCAMDTKPRFFGKRDLQLLFDLASIAMNELELRTLAMRDSLTGALSRRAFREEAIRDIALANRHGHRLSCIVLDLDHFKEINDEHGHATGDLVLIACHNVCRQELRATDLIGRLGGEEFAILLPHVDRNAAMDVANKLREAISQLSIQGLAGPVHVSASFGVAELDQQTRDLDGVLKRADEGLYLSKANGRNKCSFAQPTGPSPFGALRRVFKAGKINFNKGMSTIDCTVRGLSETGASLDVVNTAGIPGNFKLQIAADDFDRRCTIANIRDRQIQVQFG